MNCPYCRSGETRVVDTRVVPARFGEFELVRRRRECRSCAHRFTTHEGMDDPPMFLADDDPEANAIALRVLEEVGDLTKRLRGQLA